MPSSTTTTTSHDPAATADRVAASDAASAATSPSVSTVPVHNHSSDDEHDRDPSHPRKKRKASRDDASCADASSLPSSSNSYTTATTPTRPLSPDPTPARPALSLQIPSIQLPTAKRPRLSPPTASRRSSSRRHNYTHGASPPPSGTSTTSRPNTPQRRRALSEYRRSHAPSPSPDEDIDVRIALAVRDCEIQDREPSPSPAPATSVTPTPTLQLIPSPLRPPPPPPTHISIHGKTLFVPSLTPLISRETLRELDLDAILRNPQLRHDLLFDPGLQFRATSGRRKRDAIEKYWTAVRREICLGCHCMMFDSSGDITPCICISTGGEGDGVWPPTKREVMPSRIPPLIAELVEVLLSIISPAYSSPSPTSASSPASAASSSPNRPIPGRRTLSAPSLLPSPSSGSPTSTTTNYPPSLTPLLQALDTSLIIQELSHNRALYDPRGLFRLLASVMKAHCAPVRDRLVEAMIQAVEQGWDEEGDVSTRKAGAVKGLKMCFEILELMKLDIANHQLQALRPYLLETAPEFELKTFHDKLRRAFAPSRGLSKTQAWLKDAVANLTPEMIIGGKRAAVKNGVRAGIVDLVFSPTITSPSTSPSAPSPSSATTTTSGTETLPETLHLDQTRLVQLASDAADLTALYMLLLLFRQLAHSSSGGKNRAAVRLDEDLMERVKREVWEVGPTRLGWCYFEGSGVGSSGKERHREKDAGKDADVWAEGMKDVMLQLAVRAAEVSSSTTGTATVTPAVPSQATLTMLDNWARTNMKPNSALHTLARKRLRAAVLEIVASSPSSSADLMAASSSASSPLSSYMRTSSSSSSYTRNAPHSLPPSNSGCASSKVFNMTGLPVSISPTSLTSPSATSPAGVVMMTPPPSSSAPKPTVSAGLETLVPEIRHLGERVGKLAGFHSRVYRTLYEADGFL